MQTMPPDSNHKLSNLEVTELAVRHCHVMKGQQLNWFHNHMFHQQTAATLKRWQWKSVSHISWGEGKRVGQKW